MAKFIQIAVSEPLSSDGLWEQPTILALDDKGTIYQLNDDVEKTWLKLPPHPNPTPEISERDKEIARNQQELYRGGKQS